MKAFADLVRSLCIYPFKGSAGSLKFDMSCRAKLDVWVIPEEANDPAFTPAEIETEYTADGFKIGDKVFKIDGSTCVTVIYSANGIAFDTSVNLLALTLGKGPPHIVPVGTFANEPSIGNPAHPLQ